jgi:hypothetical protein
VKAYLAFAAMTLAFAAALAASPAADPTADIPHLPPAASTGFVCMLEGNPNPQIVAVVVSFSDGRVVRFDARNMHGFTVEQLMLYADTAPNSRVYTVRCIFQSGGSTST